MPTLNERGHEVLDSTPMARPIHFRPPPSLQDQIKAMVRRELSDRAASLGAETFEEADDFDIGDDYDPSSPWELTADQEDALHSQANTPEPAAAAANPAEPAKALPEQSDKGSNSTPP